MKLSIKVIFILSFLTISNAVYAQKMFEKYTIYLGEDGSSRGQRASIILEEEKTKQDTLFVVDGEAATKEIKYYSRIDDDFSFKLMKYHQKNIEVDISQKGDKAILHFSNQLNKRINELDGGNSKKRLVIDISRGVILQKKAIKISALTIPFKVYMRSSSDSLKKNTNNIETNINLALTFGYRKESYSFKESQKPELRSYRYLFAFGGVNKLRLNSKNTDNNQNVDEDVILTTSWGVGYEYGFKRFGLSFLIGVDFPKSDLGKKWVFKNQPWLGFGIGYQF